MQELQVFVTSTQTKSAVLDYLVSYFEQQLIENARKGMDVKGLAEAINEVLAAFEKLEIDYGISTKETSSTENQAR